MNSVLPRFSSLFEVICFIFALSCHFPNSSIIITHICAAHSSTYCRQKTRKYRNRWEKIITAIVNLKLAKLALKLLFIFMWCGSAIKFLNMFSMIKSWQDIFWHSIDVNQNCIHLKRDKLIGVSSRNFPKRKVSQFQKGSSLIDTHRFWRNFPRVGLR